MHDTPTAQRIAMKAIIINADKQVLLLREAKTYTDGTQVNRWHLPGGRLEVGEAFIDGLRREVREETGLDIEPGKPVFVGEWHPVIKSVPMQIVGVFFICTPLGGEVILSEEHSEFAWVSQADLSAYDVMEPEPAALAAGFAAVATS